MLTTLLIVAGLCLLGQANPICQLDKETGPCKAQKPRYYYNGKTGQCELFIYGGCKGNANNFKTLKDCQSTCIQEPHESSVCDLEKDSGPCKGKFPRWYYDKTDNKCKKFNYGGCGGNGNNFVHWDPCNHACIRRPHESSVCDLEKDSGPCKGKFPRWYYDKMDNKCKKFNYGGCGGNGNNFVHWDPCNHACIRRPRGRPACDLEKDSGPCDGHIRRWYYDKTDNKCKEFVYGGCGGNDNNFVHWDACNHACIRRMLHIRRCSQEKEPGTCDGRVRRWWFNFRTGLCEEFVYTGCGGNDNNFPSMRACERTCLL